MLDLTDKDYVNFYNALHFVTLWEGGYVNDPDDPGGETKWGISKRYHPKEDILNLTPERAAEIYYNEYWIPSTAGTFDQPFSTVVFDTSVLCGVSYAKEWARQTDNDFIKLCDIRRNYHTYNVKKNPALQKFLKGWLLRIENLLQFCRTWNSTK